MSALVLYIPTVACSVVPYSHQSDTVYIATWSLKKTQTTATLTLPRPAWLECVLDSLWRCLWSCSSLRYSRQIMHFFLSCTRSTGPCRLKYVKKSTFVSNYWSLIIVLFPPSQSSLLVTVQCQSPIHVSSRADQKRSGNDNSRELAVLLYSRHLPVCSVQPVMFNPQFLPKCEKYQKTKNDHL